MEYNGPIFRDAIEGDNGVSTGTFSGVFGTILLLFALTTIVMGGIFLWKNRTSKSFNIGIHFHNPRETFDAAKVKLTQLPQYVRRNARINEFFPPKNVPTTQNTQVEMNLLQ